MGNTALSQGRTQDAITHYTQAIDLNPSNAIYYGNRAAAHMSLFAAVEAAADSARSVELDPSYWKGYYRLGQAKLYLGDSQAAKESLTKALSFTNDSNMSNNIRQLLTTCDANLAQANTHDTSSSSSSTVYEAQIEDLREQLRQEQQRSWRLQEQIETQKRLMIDHGNQMQHEKELEKGKVQQQALQQQQQPREKPQPQKLRRNSRSFWSQTYQFSPSPRYRDANKGSVRRSQAPSPRSHVCNTQFDSFSTRSPVLRPASATPRHHFSPTSLSPSQFSNSPRKRRVQSARLQRVPSSSPSRRRRSSHRFSFTDDSQLSNEKRLTPMSRNKILEMLTGPQFSTLFVAGSHVTLTSVQLDYLGQVIGSKIDIRSLLCHLLDMGLVFPNLNSMINFIETSGRFSPVLGQNTESGNAFRNAVTPTNY